MKWVLLKAVEVIKGWHNMGPHPSKLTQEQKDLAWNIYYNHSPEMKPIREALSQPESPDAVRFLNFVVENKFVKFAGNGWSRDNEEGLFTTEQLYQLFITDKKE